MQLIRPGHLALALAAATLLHACGNDTPEASKPAAAAKEEERTEQARVAVTEATRHMVSGVTSTTKPGAPVDLWFEVKERPRAGEPLRIEIAIVPRASTPHLRATFIATDGLAVQASPTPPSFKDAEAGAIYRYTLTVVPREDGAYYVSAIVLMDLEGGAEARTFALPVMVGAPADVAEKPKPPTDATGQPIESLPGT